MDDQLQKERDRVHRVSLVLNKAFLQFRRATWHTDVIDIIQRETFLLILHDVDATYRWNGYWVMFVDMFVALEDPANTAALLTTKSCYDLAHMTLLTEQLFEGMEIHLEEVVLRLKTIHRRSVITSSATSIDVNDYDFWVLRATSRTTGQQWANHLTGAQYYIPGHVSLWNDFSEKWVRKILAVLPLGTLQRGVKAVAQTKNTLGLEADVLVGAMVAWHDAVDPAMAKKLLTWRRVLDKNEEDFKRHSEKILEKGKKAVEKFVMGQTLSKRRSKAERYEKRHGDWKEEVLKIMKEVMEYKPRDVEVQWHGVLWVVSEHSAPIEQRKEFGHFGLGEK